MTSTGPGATRGWPTGPGIAAGQASAAPGLSPSRILGPPTSLIREIIVNSGDDMYFEQDFTVPSATWAIHHNFGKSPNVRIIDHSGNTAYPGVQDSDDCNTVYVTWPAPMTGKAICS